MSALLSVPSFQLATRTAGGWLERRMHAAPRLAVRAHGTGEVHLTGYAARFGSWSADLGGFVEQIAPGAFATASRSDVRCLFNHNSDLILGRTSAGTLRLWQDSLGLAVDILPPSTAVARHVVEAVRRRDVTGMSFGFIVVADRVESGDPIRRTLLEVDLIEVSPCPFPAYAQTAIDIEQPDEGARRRARRLRLALADLALAGVIVRAERKEPDMRVHYDLAANVNHPLRLSERDVRMLAKTGRLERRLDRKSGRLQPTSASRVEYLDAVEREIGGRR
jgi:uncharacterized protein